MTLLQMGSTGQAVVNLQKQLQSIGYPLLKFGADGKYGNETRDAVMDFQRKNSLKIDGIVGLATQSKLNEKTSSLWDKVTNIFSPPSPVPTPLPPAPPAVNSPTPTPISTPTVIGVEIPPANKEEGGIHPLIILGGAFAVWKIFFSRRSKK